MIGTLLFGLLIALAAGQQAPAAAQQPAAATPADVTPPGKEIVVRGQIRDADKRVCKTSIPTGSIMPKRECKSKGQWEEERARSLAAVERVIQDQETREQTRLLREQTK